jgi:hypothetical protein
VRRRALRAGRCHADSLIKQALALSGASGHSQALVFTGFRPFWHFLSLPGTRLIGDEMVIKFY